MDGRKELSLLTERRKLIWQESAKKLFHLPLKLFELPFEYRWVTRIFISKLIYQKSCNPLLALLPPSLSLSDLESSLPDSLFELPSYTNVLLKFTLELKYLHVTGSNSNLTWLIGAYSFHGKLDLQHNWVVGVNLFENSLCIALSLILSLWQRCFQSFSALVVLTSVTYITYPKTNEIFGLLLL